MKKQNKEISLFPLHKQISITVAFIIIQQIWAKIRIFFYLNFFLQTVTKMVFDHLNVTLGDCY